MKIGLFLMLAVLPAAGARADWRSVANGVQNNIEAAGLGAHAITINYHKGDIILKGEVASTDDAYRAQQAAQAAPGVQGVTNWLTVAVPADAPPVAAAPAADLLERVRAALQSRPHRSSYQVTLLGDGRSITLVGSAGSEGERAEIEQVVRSTPGVEAVRNDLTVPPPPSDDEVALRVREALLQEPELQAQDLRISASGGIVTLSGDRPDFRDIDRILSVANMVSGVHGVHNDITINGRPYMQAYERRSERTRPLAQYPW